MISAAQPTDRRRLVLGAAGAVAAATVAGQLAATPTASAAAPGDEDARVWRVHATALGEVASPSGLVELPAGPVLFDGAKVLLARQGDPAENGIYTVSESGPWALQAEQPSEGDLVVAAAGGRPVGDGRVVACVATAPAQFGVPTSEVVGDLPASTRADLLRDVLDGRVEAFRTVGEPVVVATGAQLEAAGIADYPSRGANGYLEGADGTLYAFAPRQGAVTRTEVSSPDAPLGAPVTASVSGTPEAWSASGGAVFPTPTVEEPGMAVLLLHLASHEHQGYGSLGLARTLDEGQTWEWLGEIARPALAAEDVGLSTHGNAQAVGGTLYEVTEEGTGASYLYCLVDDHSADGQAHTNLGLARCPTATFLSDVQAGVVPTFAKWTGSDWSAPALGGFAADVLPTTVSTTNDRVWRYGAASGDLLWSTTLERHVLIYSNMMGGEGGRAEIWWTTSTDLRTWSEPSPLWGGQAPSGVAQSFVWAWSGSPESPKTIDGSNFHLYYSQSDPFGPGEPVPAGAAVHRVTIRPPRRLPTIGATSPTPTDRHALVISGWGLQLDGGASAIVHEPGIDGTTTEHEVADGGLVFVVLPTGAMGPGLHRVRTSPVAWEPVEAPTVGQRMVVSRQSSVHSPGIGAVLVYDGGSALPIGFGHLLTQRTTFSWTITGDGSTTTFGDGTSSYVGLGLPASLVSTSKPANIVDPRSCTVQVTEVASGRRIDPATVAITWPGAPSAPVVDRGLVPTTALEVVFNAAPGSGVELQVTVSGDRIL